MKTTPCNGVHCKCMNLDGMCPNNHFATCPTHNPKFQGTPAAPVEEWREELRNVGEEWVVKWPHGDVLGFVGDKPLSDFIRTILASHQEKLLREIQDEIVSLRNVVDSKGVRVTSDGFVDTLLSYIRRKDLTN